MRTFLLVFGIGLLGAVPSLLGASTARAVDRHAMAACQLAATADGRGASDLETLRRLVQEISNMAAQSTEPALRGRATMLGRVARQNNPATLQSALKAFQGLCQKTVGVTSAKSTEVPEAEFDRQVEGVLERSGVPDASCDKQQFGGGWTAVCR